MNQLIHESKMKFYSDIINENSNNLPVFVNLINLSFKDGLVPALFKEAVLDPVIKKDSLDHEIYQNYRLT